MGYFALIFWFSNSFFYVRPLHVNSEILSLTFTEMSPQGSPLPSVGGDEGEGGWFDGLTTGLP